jgi:F-type H+-transporting ATPase subunit b
MRIDWWTLGLQTINFLVLLAILGRFLFRPIARIVADRQAEVAQLLDDAQAKQEQAQTAMMDAETERVEMGQARERLLEDAQKDAESQRAALVEAARTDAARQRVETAAEIARMYDEEEARIGRRANRLATDIAARLLEGPSALLPIDVFLGPFEQALAALPQTLRETVGASSARVGLLSAQPLNEKQLAACRAVIARVLGRETSLTPGVDPSLIAGLRLTTENVSIDVNFRTDLERVLAALNADSHG